MNAFWRTISYGSILALWIQGSQCLPSFSHSQEDKEPKKMVGSFSINSQSRAMDVEGEEPYEESGESESNSPSSSIVIAEVPHFQEVLNRPDRDEHSAISDPLSAEFNAQKELCPIGNSRITIINSETKKLLPEESSEIILFPKNHNPLRDFFQEHMESFFPDNSKDEEEKAYMTKIFSKTLESISLKERDDAIVFLMEKNIPPTIIEKLFHINRYMIEAFKICPPLDPEESYENRREKAIELLKKNISITKISYIAHISKNDIKNIANKEGIVTKEKKKDIDYSAIPQDFLLEMDINTSLVEKQKRALFLLENRVPVKKIASIVHMDFFDIKKLAEKYGITTRQSEQAFQVPDEIREYMVEMPQDAPREEKQKRALFLLENRVPVKKIASIVHMDPFYIKKLAEKYGITTRQSEQAFQVPDEIREYMVEMPQDAPREEKEKRALFLLENKVPLIKIASIVHMDPFYIKKLAEKYGITTRQSEQAFQVPNEIKEYMVEMLQDAPREEKEKRTLFLLEHKVPMDTISLIVHMATFDIKKLAGKNGITIRQSFKAFQVPDEIKEYMTEMPRDATREEKEKRALILLENKVPLTKIGQIVHMDFFNIKQLAEKHGIATRKIPHTFQVPDEIKEYMTEMPKDTPREEKEKRALMLLEHKIPMEKIASIVHMATVNIKKFAEKYGITIRESIKNFQVPDEIKEYMVEMPQNATKEEKEKRALFLLENKVPIGKIQEIVHMDFFNIKKCAAKYGIATRQIFQTFQAPDKIKEYMVEMPKDVPREEKEKRALFLLENKVPIGKILSIVHMAAFDIKKLAEKHGISIRKKTYAFQVPDEIKEYMVEMPQNATKEEKEKRALFLLENKVPLIKIASIIHKDIFNIRKLAEKNGISIRKQTHTFQVPDEIKEYMVEMHQNATKEEKEKRALFLLENKVPLIKIASIIHKDIFNIRKLAEKNGISIRKKTHAFQVPDEIKEYMTEMPTNTLKEAKEKRVLFLLEHKVPIKKIQEIVHMDFFNIKKLAEKHGISIRKKTHALQVPDEIKEYMVEMPKNATKEERRKRALFLLENKVPMQKICEIIHISRKVIKKLAEKHQIATRENKKY